MRRRASCPMYCFSILSLLVLPILSGCEQPATSNGGANGRADSAATTGEGAGATDDSAEADQAGSDGSSSDSDAAPASQVTLQVVDREGYDKVIAEQKGKVVLVDFWATWCGPCTEQFPHTVELAEKYKQAGLVAVSVSFDEVDSKQAALDFLTEHKATFPNLLSEYGIGTESFEKFEIEGGVPYYKLYDRTGKLRDSFSDQVEGKEGVEPVDKIEIRVKELVAE